MTFPALDQPGNLYFITATIVGWKPLFAQEQYRAIILDSLAWLRDQKKMALYAFVIMPSHLHLIGEPIGVSISQLTQQFGSFTAHAILKLLQNNHQHDLLQFFHAERRDQSRNKSIWQDIQAKNIFSLDFLQQKLEYIHNNPIAGAEGSRDRADYPFSSACFFDRNQKPIIEIDDLNDRLFN